MVVVPDSGWYKLKKEDCVVEPCVRTFLEHSEALFPGRQGAEADKAERLKLARTFICEVERFRDVPLEDRGWDIDVILG